MAETIELSFLLEKAVHNLMSAAQEASQTSSAGSNLTALLYDASNSTQHVVDALRGAPGAPPAESADQALRRLGATLDGLRVYLPRGSDVRERLALARWLCDTALTAVTRSRAAPSA